MPKKTYLRPPTDDYATDKNIRLGDVWRNPRDPGSFIGAPHPIPDEIEINHTYKGSWTIDLGRESHVKAGLWAKIAQLPITADARAHWDNVEDGAYKVPTMETYSIEPTPAYVKASVADVSAEISKSGDNLYMITGVKIARGGEGLNKESRNFGVGSSVAVSAAVGTRVPVDVGGQFSYSKGDHHHQGFGSTGDFVFAYRIREIFYKRGVLKTKEYNKGAVLGEDMISDGKADTEKPRFIIENAEIGETDVEVDREIVHFIDDNDDECDFVISL
jgi:hypothetical protein